MPQTLIKERPIIEHPPTRIKEIEIEHSLEEFSSWMDSRFRIPVVGWHFGLNAIIDLIPGVGDIASSLIAIYLLISAVRYRVPKISLLRMGLNIAIYFVVGLIPWLGDLFGAWWKPNQRNLRILKSRATASPEEVAKGRTSDWLFVGMIVGVLFLLLFSSLAIAYFIFSSIIQLISLLLFPPR